MAKKVFILGASGFIGGWLMNRFSSGKSCAAVGYSSADCDLLSFGSVRRALSSAAPEDVILVLSCITRLRDNSPGSLVKNIRMACNIARFVEAHPVSQLIYFNTVDVYGLIPEGTVISESLLPNPSDYYAISKLTGEFILKRALSGTQAAFLSLRLSGVYGPGDEGKSTINALLSSLLHTGKITIFGDGTDTRDFVFVDDVYKIVEEAIRNKVSGIVNVATGKSLPMADIAAVVKSLAGKDCVVEFVPRSPNAEKRQSHMVYDTSRFQKLFPGFAFADLKAGLSLYMRHVAGEKKYI